VLFLGLGEVLPNGVTCGGRVKEVRVMSGQLSTETELRGMMV